MNNLKPAKPIAKIINNLVSEAYKKHGAFLAKDEAEFKKKANLSIKYNSIQYQGGGLDMTAYYDSSKGDFEKSISKALKNAVEIDKLRHTKEEIILRELINNHCFKKGSIDFALGLQYDYKYSQEEIERVYIANIDC